MHLALASIKTLNRNFVNKDSHIPLNQNIHLIKIRKETIQYNE